MVVLKQEENNHYISFKQLLVNNNLLNSNKLVCFYMSNNSEIATKSLKFFSNYYNQFKKLKLEVLVFSGDDELVNKQIKTNLKLPFYLFSDQHLTISREFNVTSSREVHFNRLIDYINPTIILLNKDNEIINTWNQELNNFKFNEIIEYLNSLAN